VYLGAGAAVVEAGKILLVRRHDIDVWEMPGGLVEPGEAPWEAAIRECLEESGLQVEVEELSGMYHRRAKDIVVMVFRCRRVSGEPRPTEEAREVGWFGFDSLPDNMVEVSRERASDVGRRVAARLVTQEGRSNSDLREAAGIPTHEQPWWTRTGRTRPNVRCVIRRGDEILCAPAREPGADIDFYYLPGGGIDFGERSADALRREVREETGQELTDVRLLGVLENTFTWTGDPHHTIEFVYEARVVDDSFYSRAAIVISEPGIDFPAQWRPLDAFDPLTAPLYPEGLLELLR